MTRAAERLADYLTATIGVRLERGGLRAALDRSLRVRVRESGLPSIDTLVDRVLSGDPEELEPFVEVVSVPHTWFFRDPEQLDGIVEVLREASRKRRALDVWVAGCATGEDAFTLAMLSQSVPADVRIVASDVCRASLQRAQAARFGGYSLRAVPGEFARHFVEEGNGYRVAPGIRERVRFVPHNLLDPALTSDGGWDVILCRNVLIYFGRASAFDCARRLGDVLRPDGWLFVGAGELLQDVPKNLAAEPLGGRVGFRLRSSSHDRTSQERASSPKVELTAAVPVLPRVAPSAEPHVSGTLPGSQAPALATGSRSLVESSLPAETGSPTETAIPSVSAETIAALFEAEQFEDAARAVSEASARDPLDAQLRMLSGIALYSVGDLGHALLQLRAALLLDDSLWPAALYLGMCLENSGSPGHARSEYRHAARLLSEPQRADHSLPEPLRAWSRDLSQLALDKARL